MKQQKPDYFKAVAAAVLLLLGGSPSLAQDYTWMKGGNAPFQPGVYGTMGATSPNSKPGSRETATSWHTANGELWLFGGSNNGFSQLNDLWKYEIASGNWTWMGGSVTPDSPGSYGTQGVASAANIPGARQGSASWTDASGNLWLYGGAGYDAFGMQAELSDLWKYTPSTGQWTWVLGTDYGMQAGVYGIQGMPDMNNFPGARQFATSWTDASGNFWLFGGVGYSAVGYGTLNDLWKFDVTIQQWTWVGGSDFPDQNGVYGNMGTPSAFNMPGGRYLSNSWVDASGNVWLFGGSAFDANNSYDDVINDLWKYDPTTNQWSWMAGDLSSGQSGIYSSIGLPGGANIPGARFGASAWTKAGKLYLFGGYGMDTNANEDVLNDLWEYNPANGDWTWLKGSDVGGPVGTYGALGITAAANTPGGRAASCTWQDNTGKLWLFGGVGNGATIGSQGDLNDLWKLDGCSVTLNATTHLSKSEICAGETLTITASGASSYIWSNSALTGSVITETESNAGYYTFTCTPFDANGCKSSPIPMGLIVRAVPAFTAGVTKAVICKGAAATITLTPNAYHYNLAGSNGFTTTAATNSVHISSSETATYVITVTENHMNTICTTTASVVQVVDPCTGIGEQAKTNAAYVVYPNPNNGVFTITTTEFGAATQLVLFNALGQQVLSESLDAAQTSIRAQLPKGIYYYTVMQNNKAAGGGKIMID